MKINWYSGPYFQVLEPYFPQFEGLCIKKWLNLHLVPWIWILQGTQATSRWHLGHKGRSRFLTNMTKGHHQNLLLLCGKMGFIRKIVASPFVKSLAALKRWQFEIHSAKRSLDYVGLLNTHCVISWPLDTQLEVFLNPLGTSFEPFSNLNFITCTKWVKINTLYDYHL